jgi:hypothetical protein
MKKETKLESKDRLAHTTNSTSPVEDVQSTRPFTHPNHIKMFESEHIPKNSESDNDTESEEEISCGEHDTINTPLSSVDQINDLDSEDIAFEVSGKISNVTMDKKDTEENSLKRVRTKDGRIEKSESESLTVKLSMNFIFLFILRWILR